MRGVLAIAVVALVRRARAGGSKCDEVIQSSAPFTGTCSNKWSNLKPLLRREFEPDDSHTCCSGPRLGFLFVVAVPMLNPSNPMIWQRHRLSWGTRG
jgi:hypothetical protein